MSSGTYMPNPQDVARKWYVVDGSGIPLGRLASEVAKILRGKNKPIYTPHADTGDFVIIVNAGEVALTGKKLDTKIYYHHSLYPGGLKSMKYRDFMAKKPERAVEKAVKGMLPHNKLGRAQGKKLKVYAGSEHNNQAQNPVEYKLKG